MCPFKSKAQKRYLYINNPELAKEFESKTTNKYLLDYVKRKKRK